MSSVSTPLPRVTIQFCTQCKWMLRAAYFAQELLSTFNTALGEVALQPSTGGTFIVSLYSLTPISDVGGEIQIQHDVLWDRKVEGGFPETKELKRRVRDIIEPGRDLGHVDRRKKKEVAQELILAEPNQPSSEQSKGSAAQEKADPEKETPEALQTTRATGDVRGQEEDASRKSTPMSSAAKGMGNQDEMEKKAQRNGDSSMCEDCH